LPFNCPKVGDSHLSTPFQNPCVFRHPKNKKFKESALKVSEMVRKAKTTCSYHNGLCNTLDAETSGSKNYWYAIKLEFQMLFPEI
jgi:hypothetical protein